MSCCACSKSQRRPQRAACCHIPPASAHLHACVPCSAVSTMAAGAAAASPRLPPLAPCGLCHGLHTDRCAAPP
eukprot:4669417-Pleurochrysis_carterae.AAC.1